MPDIEAAWDISQPAWAAAGLPPPCSPEFDDFVEWCIEQEADPLDSYIYFKRHRAGWDERGGTWRSPGGIPEGDWRDLGFPFPEDAAYVAFVSDLIAPLSLPPC